MKRALFFLGTNVAVILVLSITMWLFGIEPYLDEQRLDLNALLAFVALFGFGGAFISHWRCQNGPPNGPSVPKSSCSRELRPNGGWCKP